MNNVTTEANRKSAKKTWKKPTISPVRSGIQSKFGATTHNQWKDNIDGVLIKDLIDKHGSPLFVISEKKLRANMRRLKRVFMARYPDVLFGWSYKTNYLGAVCNVLHQEGSWAEVVSNFEYEKARSLGVPGDKIIFNGPYKTRDILVTAINENARIHIDHIDELYLIEDISNELNKDVKVTLRLNFDTGYTEPWSRFGFNVESGQALNAAWRITSSKHLKLTGLHSHIGTFILEPLAYSSQVRIMCEFMKTVEDKTACEIDYIDVGGGFASLNSLQGIYLPPEQVVPSIEQYADAITSVLLEYTEERVARGRSRPQLVLETGRAVVDDTEVLISSVFANKKLPDGRNAIVLDAGVNLLFTAFWYNHHITPTRPLDGRAEETVLYGPLCMNIDVLRASIMLPPINVGDTLVFSPVGAYNNTQWLQFIEYRPNVVMVHEDQTVSVIREAEDLSVVTAQERLPEHLKNPFK
ncbi:MAG: alanine racemase [Gammaproteobacteria bacterium]|nr:alanine racemase [Gammaproteobacteria bacterium]